MGVTTLHCHTSFPARARVPPCGLGSRCLRLVSLEWCFSEEDCPVEEEEDGTPVSGGTAKPGGVQLTVPRGEVQYLVLTEFLREHCSALGLRPLLHVGGRAVWDHGALCKGRWFGEKGECFSGKCLNGSIWVQACHRRLLQER